MEWRAFLPLLRLSLAGFTDGSVNAASAAWRLASSRGHLAVTPEHLLAGMASTGYSRATLARLGLDLSDRAEEVLALVEPPTFGLMGRCRGFGPEVQALLTSAREESRRTYCSYIGTQHLVLALLSGPRCRAVDILHRCRVDAKAIRVTIADDQA